MSTSKNMPARFKSRTHLKIVLGNKSKRGLILEGLLVCKEFRNWANYRLVQCDKPISKYERAWIRQSLQSAKNKILELRAYRKSVVLPRLP